LEESQSWRENPSPCYPRSEQKIDERAAIQYGDKHTSLKALVAFARPLHLPAPASARVAYPDAT